MVFGLFSNFFEKIRGPGKIPESRIIIRHRGAPQNKRSIMGEHITEIRKGSFYYANDDNEIFTPMDRVLEIWMENNLVWKKRTKKQNMSVQNQERPPKPKKVGKAGARRKPKTAMIKTGENKAVKAKVGKSKTRTIAKKNNLIKFDNELKKIMMDAASNSIKIRDKKPRKSLHLS